MADKNLRYKINAEINDSPSLAVGIDIGITTVSAAVRKNPVLQKLIADRFNATVYVNTAKEEAATGAALFSAFAIGKIEYNNGFSGYLNCYQ